MSIHLAKSINARNAGVFPPCQISHICRWQMSIPLAKSINARNAGVFPRAIYGEGVADRPGVRSHSHSQKFSHLPQADVYFPISIYGEGGRG